jgi:hypothetical protein
MLLYYKMEAADSSLLKTGKMADSSESQLDGHADASWNKERNGERQ